MMTDEFKKIAGDVKVLSKPEEREMYSHDIGDLPTIMAKTFFKTTPDLVVQPKNIEEIIKVLKFAGDNGIPVIPRGAASWGFGGVIPANAGIVIDLSPLRKILAIDTANKTVTVEAGARWGDIDITAKKQGLCLMTYPSSKFSTVGGWIATGGVGINTFRYGHLTKQIVTMTVVTGSGEVKKLSPSDSEFNCFVSTEGEMGIIAEVTLKLRDVPQGSYSHLLYFAGEKEAFNFIDKLTGDSSNKLNLNTIRFVDEIQLEDINKVVRSDLFKKKAAVLVELGRAEDEKHFVTFMGGNAGIEEAPRHVASYLWNERLFGLKTKRLGPTILASEVIMPNKAAATFIEKSKKTGRQYGFQIAIDVYVLDARSSLIMATFLCDSRKRKYIINMPLAEMLTRIAVSLGAEPYGLGIWNSAFFHNRYSSEQQRKLQSCKSKYDPHKILNQGKFFAGGANGISRLVFSPAFFIPAMQFMITTGPVTGRLITTLFGKDKQVENLDLELSTHACAKCGNCIAVCPAYLITGNEGMTAKGKIALAKKLQNNQPVTSEEAANAFMCMRCKACEEICQTNLELMMLWDALENKLEGKFGRPDTQINDFLKKVDDSREYWDMVERNA